MTVRLANQEDLAKITALGLHLLSSHISYDEEYFQLEDNSPQFYSDWARLHINSSNQFIFVSENDGETEKTITGFISGYIKILFPWFKIKQVGHISFLAVDEKWRRQGVGRHLELKACEWFKNRGLTYVELYTNEKNYPGISAWQSYGYKPFNRFLSKKI